MNAPVQSLEDVVALLEEQGQMILASTVMHYAAPVAVTPGRIDIVPLPGAPPKLAGDLGAALTQITGTRWIVTVARESGGATVAQTRASAAAAARQKLQADPMVSAVLLAFPGAVIEES